MLKVYEKPKLVALSVSGNDILCAACTIDVVGNNADPTYTQTVNEMIAAGFPNPVTADDNKCQTIVTGYCKFSGSNIIYNS